jgi:hypothetical protein
MIFLFPEPILGELIISVFSTTRKEDIEYFYFIFFTYLKVEFYVIVTGLGLINTPALFTF